MRRVLLDLSQLSTAQTAGTVPLVGGSGCITWHSAYETTGAASASYSLFDEGDSAGQQLMFVTLSAGQSTRDYIGLHALPFLGGLWFESESGSVLGSITCWVDHVCEDVHRWVHSVERLEGAAALKELGAFGT